MSFDVVDSVLEHNNDLERLDSELETTTHALLLNNDGVAIDAESLPKVKASLDNLTKKETEINTWFRTEYKSVKTQIDGAERNEQYLTQQKDDVLRQIRDIETNEIGSHTSEITRIQVAEIGVLKQEIQDLEDGDIATFKGDVRIVETDMATQKSNITLMGDEINNLNTAALHESDTTAKRALVAQKKAKESERKTAQMELRLLENQKRDVERKLRDGQEEQKRKRQEIKEWRTQQDKLRQEIKGFKTTQGQKQQQIRDLDKQLFEQADKKIQLEQKLLLEKGKYTNRAARKDALQRINDVKGRYQRVLQLGSSLQLEPKAIEKDIDEIKKTGWRKRGSLEVATAEDFFKGPIWEDTVFSIKGDKTSKKVAIDETTGKVSLSGMNLKDIPENITFSVTATIPMPPAVGTEIPKTTHTKKYTLNMAAVRQHLTDEGDESESKLLEKTKKIAKGIPAKMGSVIVGTAHAAGGIIALNFAGVPLAMTSAVWNTGGTILQEGLKKSVDDTTALHKSEQGWMYGPKMLVKVPFQLAKNGIYLPFRVAKNVFGSRRGSGKRYATGVGKRTWKGDFAIGDTIKDNAGTVRNLYGDYDVLPGVVKQAA